MADLAYPRRAPDAASCIAVTGLVFAAVYALSHIPAPGVNPDSLGSLKRYPSHLPAVRLSIIALLFTPVTTALMIVEVFRLLLPGMAKWEAPSGAPSLRVSRVLLAIAFLLALFQGWGVASALEELDLGVDGIGGPAVVLETGDLYRFTFALTQIAGVALLVALAGIITRHGIGSGFWVMFAGLELSDLPYQAALVRNDVAQGAVDISGLIGLVALLAGGGVALVFLFRKGVEHGRTAEQSAGDLILPVFLGIGLASFIYGLFLVAQYFVFQSQITAESLAADSPLRLIMTAALIALVSRVRCGSDAERGWQIAALGAGLFVAFEAIRARFGWQLVRADVFVIAVVVCLLAWRQCGPRVAADEPASS